jgi:hypothetical protein
MVPGFLLSSIPGVEVVSQRDAHGRCCVEFSIERGAEEQAVHSLIRLLLDSGGELWFFDQEQGDGESIVSACRTQAGLEMMRGGHGYSSGWSPADTETIKAAFLRLVRFSQSLKYPVHGGLEGAGLVGGSGFRGLGLVGGSGFEPYE